MSHHNLHYIAVMAASAALVAGCGTLSLQSQSRSAGRGTPDVIAALRDAKKHMPGTGARVAPWPVGRTTRFLDAETSQPLEQVYVMFPPEFRLDTRDGRGVVADPHVPVWTSAPGYLPVTVEAGDLLGGGAGEVRLTRQPPGPRVAWADSYTTATLAPHAQTDIPDTLLKDLEDAIRRRGGTPLPHKTPEMELPCLLATDTLDEMLFKAGYFLPPHHGDPVIVDDVDRGFTAVGGWKQVESPFLHGKQAVSGNTTYGWCRHESNTAGDTATFRVDGLAAGRYQTWLFWDVDPRNTCAARLEIFPQGSRRAAVTWEIDMTDGTGQWNQLGDWVASTSRPLSVVLTNKDGRRLVADAVRFVPIDDPGKAK